MKRTSLTQQPIARWRKLTIVLSFGAAIAAALFLLGYHRRSVCYGVQHHSPAGVERIERAQVRAALIESKLGSLRIGEIIGRELFLSDPSFMDHFTLYHQSGGPSDKLRQIWKQIYAANHQNVRDPIVTVALGSETASSLLEISDQRCTTM